MSQATLTPALARYAEECVRAGRYASVEEVQEAALALLRRAEDERAELLASLVEANAEGERDGFVTAEDALAGMDEEIRALREAGARRA
jgi:putative addiction module CopG family antidote